MRNERRFGFDFRTNGRIVIIDRKLKLDFGSGDRISYERSGDDANPGIPDDGEHRNGAG